LALTVPPSIRLDEDDFKPIPGTERAGSYVRDPSGDWLAFVASASEQASSQRHLSKVRVDGSSLPIKIVDWDASWESLFWLNDGDLLITVNNHTQFLRLPNRPPNKRREPLKSAAAAR
jgi:hypothetical protein